MSKNTIQSSIHEMETYYRKVRSMYHETHTKYQAMTARIGALQFLHNAYTHPTIDSILNTIKIWKNRSSRFQYCPYDQSISLYYKIKTETLLELLEEIRKRSDVSYHRPSRTKRRERENKK